jgi:D-alanyl-D-alanine carboxypeptidase/D-alanyl-D-alanine-endopeptidase (penicillin-binding protein 4)
MSKKFLVDATSGRLVYLKVPFGAENGNLPAAAVTKRKSMNRFNRFRTFWLYIAVSVILGSAAYSQSTPPLLQDIRVQPDADPSALVKKTSSTSSTGAARANSSIPVLADVDIPGYTGILVQKMDGTNVVEIGSNLTFNPASNVKIATAFAVLKTFGPEYRFPTNVWTDGTLDQSTGTLTGNIYVSGRDPIFGYAHAISIANELNHLGIRSVTGDLIVTSDFAMNYSSAASRTSQALFTSLDSSKRPAAATRAWLDFLNNSGRANKGYSIPGVTFTGSAYVQPLPSNLKLLFTHESAPMREIIKATLCYSNNFLAERLGDMLGGPYAVAQIVRQNVGLQPSEFSIQTSNGLGINRVSPAAMMKLLRTFNDDLARYQMTYADIMPVAGIDKGTLEERFDTDFSRGSVVGKTGTLPQTDGGVSALAGEMNTRSGKLLFVIFNQHGSVARFRAFQNNYVSLIQGAFGGAAPLDYTPINIDTRLSRSRIEYPALQASLDR